MSAVKPAVPEVERAVLGGLLLAPERLPEVRGVLAPEDLSEPWNANIYVSILTVAAAGSTPDRLTLQAELERRGLLAASGGVSYLSALADDLPDLSRIGQYARDVARAAQRRRLIEAAQEVSRNGTDDGAVERLREALEEAAPPSDARIWTLRELLSDPEAVALPEPLIPRLAWPGRVTLLAAPEKLGKSTFVAAAVAAATRGQLWLGEAAKGIGAAVLWATEEHPGDVARRLQSFGADPDALHIMQWGPDPPADIRAQTEALRPALVVVDTLTGVAEHARPDSGSSSDWAAIMRPLVRLARETGAAILIVHHSRRTDGAYRDSSEIGAAVDVIAEMSGASTGTHRRISWRGRYGRGTYGVRLIGKLFQLTTDQDVEDLEEAIISHVRRDPGCSLRGLCRAVEGRDAAITAAAATLTAGGRLIDEGSGNRRAYRLPTAARSAAHPIDGLGSTHGGDAGKVANRQLPQARQRGNAGGNQGERCPPLPDLGSTSEEAAGDGEGEP